MASSEYFNYERERSCKCGCGMDMNQEALNRFDELRETYGGPLKANSGARCHKYNKQIGGRPASKHLKGYAFDFDVQGADQQRLILAALRTGAYGIGVYSNFVHIDYDPKVTKHNIRLW